jgi:hypothetical protein
MMNFKALLMLLGSLLFQSSIVSFASFLVWFWLLRQYLVVRFTNTLT